MNTIIKTSLVITLCFITSNFLTAAAKGKGKSKIKPASNSSSSSAAAATASTDHSQSSHPTSSSSSSSSAAAHSAHTVSINTKSTQAVHIARGEPGSPPTESESPRSSDLKNFLDQYHKHRYSKKPLAPALADQVLDLLAPLGTVAVAGSASSIVTSFSTTVSNCTERFIMIADSTKPTNNHEATLAQKMATHLTLNRSVNDLAIQKNAPKDAQKVQKNEQAPDASKPGNAPASPFRIAEGTSSQTPSPANSPRNGNNG